jgi:hypothetical protein
MPTTSSTDRLARATEDLVAILQLPHPATPSLQQGTIVNDAMKQLTALFSPPNRNETAMAAPSPRVLETDTSAPRVDENNNSQPPRVVDTTITTTTALYQLRNKLRTKAVHSSERSRTVRTNSVRKLRSITEENVPFTTGTTIRKAFNSFQAIRVFGKARFYFH